MNPRLAKCRHEICGRLMQSLDRLRLNSLIKTLLLERRADEQAAIRPRNDINFRRVNYMLDPSARPRDYRQHVPLHWPQRQGQRPDRARPGAAAIDDCRCGIRGLLCDHLQPVALAAYLARFFRCRYTHAMLPPGFEAR